LYRCLPCRDGSARQGRTPGASAAGAAARSAVAVIHYGSIRQRMTSMTSYLNLLLTRSTLPSLESATCTDAT
jgi:hypothetical protein